MALRSCFKQFARFCPFLTRQSCSNMKSQFVGFSTRMDFLKSNPSAKRITAAVCCLGISGGVYGYLSAAPGGKREMSIEITEVPLVDYYTPSQSPDHLPSRKVNGPATALCFKLKLYQYQTCPFCCKVRTFLEYYGIPYDIVEVHPVKRKELSFSKYKKVPILVVKDKNSDVEHQLNDSTAIISILGTFMLKVETSLPEILKSYIPVKYVNDDGKDVIEISNRYFLLHSEYGSKKRSDEDIRKEKKWREWVDKELVHVLSPNIYRTKDEAIQAFKHFSNVGEWEKHFSKFECLLAIYGGAIAMFFVGKRLKKKHSLKDDVRQSLYDSCDLWMKNVGKANFMGGSSPNLADLSVYGVLSSIEGCQAFDELLQNTDIGPWYSNVKKEVQNHAGYSKLQKIHT